MMKKFLAIASVATLLAACTNNDEPALQHQPITVTASVDGLDSRSGYSSENLPATFYLSIDQEGENYDYDKVEMTKGTGNTYTPKQTLVWASDNRDGITIKAYTINTTDVAAHASQNVEGNLTASDLLGAVATTGSTTAGLPITIDVQGGINIRFSHLLCKLDVSFAWGTEYDGKDKTITGVTLKNFAQTGTLSEADATVTSTAAADIAAWLADGKAEAIFVPFTPTSDATPQLVINATVDGEAKVFVVNITAPTGGFVGGNAYTLTVTMGGTKISSVAVSVGGWGSGSLTDSDLETEETQS